MQKIIIMLRSLFSATQINYSKSNWLKRWFFPGYANAVLCMMLAKKWCMAEWAPHRWWGNWSCTICTGYYVPIIANGIINFVIFNYGSTMQNRFPPPQNVPTLPVNLLSWNISTHYEMNTYLQISQSEEGQCYSMRFIHAKVQSILDMTIRSNIDLMIYYDLRLCLHGCNTCNS